MKQSITALLAILVAGVTAEPWAGPVEEVVQIAGPRVQALEQGDVDAYVAAYADNAVFQSSLTAFRIEGKEAIRTYFTELFQLYPKRRVLPRQPTVRAYNDDLVIQNGYSVLYLTNQNGQVSTHHLRSSVTWAKTGGRWQIVDQHTSRLPIASSPMQ
jgi:uncharacterized protein (TIGR02246 family)